MRCCVIRRKFRVLAAGATCFSRSPVLKDLPLLSDGAIQKAVGAARRNPEAFEHWLAENADSPIHAKAAGLAEQ